MSSTTTQNMEAGQEVEYLVGKKWLKGTIHGVRKAEVGGKEILLSYLIDTGNDVRVDEYHRNFRSEELGRRFDKHIKAGKTPEKAQELLASEKNLPEDKITVEKVRQPEQVDVRPEDVRPA